MCIVTTGTTTAENQNGPSEAPISAKDQADNADQIAMHKADGSKPINYIDLEQPRREHLFGLPLFAQNWIVQNVLRQKDERNITIFYVGMNIMMTSLPMAAGIFHLEKGGSTPTWALTLAGLAYFVFHLKTHARSFILALHYTSHCSIFNRNLRLLNHLYTSVLSCFFGIPPFLYHAHHVVMHHYGDNQDHLDLSSTMKYNRGSKFHHFLYMLRFFLATWIELPILVYRQGNNNDVVIKCIFGEVFFYGGMVKLFMSCPIATFWVFIVPWVAVSFSLMQGNFKEHIFVDPDDPSNNYKSAITCINAPANALTFNTGYHIEHHEDPGLPWYRMPALFLKNIPKHAANDSFLFSGIGTMEVGTLALNGKFEELTEYYLNVGQPKRTKAELIVEFKRRMNPITTTSRVKSE
jgi:fatty acid desaturase